MAVHDESLRCLRRSSRCLKDNIDDCMRYSNANYLSLNKGLTPKINTIGKRLDALIQDLNNLPFRRMGKKIDDLTIEECQELMSLNERLREIEIVISKKFEDIKTSLFEKVMRDLEKCPTADYEIFLKIVFFLDETGLEYDEDSDNIVADFTHLISIEMFDEDDHNDQGLSPEHPLCAAPHCYLFHSLYDHVYAPKLGWDDILRIGSIWADIRVWHQYEFDLRK